MLLDQLDISVAQSRSSPYPFQSSVSIVNMSSPKENYALDFKVNDLNLVIATELS